MMYLVKRALAKSFGNMQQHNSQHPHQRPQSSQPQHDVVETIWAGMTTDQLRAAFGTPQSKENSKEKNEESSEGGEIWIYSNLNGQGTRTAITVENQKVKSWTN